MINCCLSLRVQYYLSLRTSPQTGVAIPRLEGKCTDQHQKMGVPAIFGGNRYLVPLNRGIATTSVRTGLAMTAFFRGAKQQFIFLLPMGEKSSFPDWKLLL